MSLRFICIELRENLRCANVFLQFNQNLKEIEFLKIDIKNGELQIKDENDCQSFKLSDYFDLDARTLSNLTVSSNNASFRLSIGDVFDKENITKINNNKKLEYPIRPIFIIGQQSSVHCSNCKCNLFDLSCVLRMREFPTGAIDTNEFFCHAAADFTEILVPRICDIYFGFQFVVINTELLDTSVKLKSNHLYCRRCLQYLGETLFNNKAAKMWIQSLLLRNEGTETFCDLASKANSAILLQKIVDDCSDHDETSVHSMSFARIILEANFPSRKRKYLMIQVLEKALKILRNETPLLQHTSSNTNNNNIQHEKLVGYKSFKLLFRFVEETAATAPNGIGIGNISDKSAFRTLPVLLQYWQQDISIQTLNVPFQLFEDLLQDLEQNSLLIPEFYRYSKDDFKLSYVFYQN